MNSETPAPTVETGAREAGGPAVVTRVRRIGPPCGCPVIYYAKVGGLIKIGFTSNLAVRFRNYPPGTKLLAWRTDATLEDEQEIHREMRHLLAAGNEWYWPTPEVLAIVNQARVDCGIAAAIA